MFIPVAGGRPSADVIADRVAPRTRGSTLSTQNTLQEDAGRAGARIIMSEGYTIEGPGDEIAGIVVRQDGERSFRFHSAKKDFDPLDGHVFVNPAAAQRAAREFANTPRAQALRSGRGSA